MQTHTALINQNTTHTINFASSTSFGTLLAAGGSVTFNAGNSTVAVQSADFFSNGSLNWAGGTLTASQLHTAARLAVTSARLNADRLTVGQVSNASQVLVLVNSTVTVGSADINGYLDMRGGVLNCAGPLSIFDPPGLVNADFEVSSTSTIELARILVGGPLTIGGLGNVSGDIFSGRVESPSMKIGGSGSTNFRVSSGSQIVTGSIELGDSSNGTSTFQISGGASVVATGISVNPNAFLNASGTIQTSIDFSGRVSLGGTITGPVTGNGSLVVGSGRLQSLASNSGSTSITGGIFDFGFNNFGVATMTGGTMSTAFNNHADATLNFFGGAAAVSNDGLMHLRTQSTGPGISIVNHSSGTVTLSGNILGNAGTIENQGRLMGTGTIQGVMQIANSGMITTVGGPLVFEPAVSVANLAGGTIRNAPLTTLSVRNSSLSSHGNIDVNAGGGVEFSGVLNVQTGRLNMLGGVLAVEGNVTIAPTGALVGYGQVNASALDNAGSIVFNGPAQLQSNLNNTVGGTITIRNATTIVYGNTSNAGAIVAQNGTIVFEGGGGSLSGNGALRVEPAGRAIASSLEQGQLSLIGSANDPAVVTIRARADGGAASRVNSMTIAQSAGEFNGAVDLADTGLVIDYAPGATPITSINTMLAAGYDMGAWSGAGIHSRAAATDATARTALGFAEANDIGSPASFLGQDVDASSLLIRYTLYGDANVDGVVNISDFSLLAANFNSSSYWAKGDFNYDAVTNIADFALLAANFNQSLPADLPRQSIPEPTVFAGVAFAAFVAQARRWAR